MSPVFSAAEGTDAGALRRLAIAPLLVPFVLSIVLGTLFLRLADEVREGDTLAADQATLRTIDARTASIPVAVADTLSLPGAEVAVGGIALVLMVVFLLRRHLLDALFVAASVGGYVALTLIVKHVVQRTRPLAFFRVPESGYGFPSGHTLGATCLTGAALYFLWRSQWRVRTKVALTLLLVALVAVVGMSRLVLGVHYPTDVLGGLLLGGAWIAVAVMGRSIAGQCLARYRQRQAATTPTAAAPTVQ